MVDSNISELVRKKDKIDEKVLENVQMINQILNLSRELFQSNYY